MFNRQTHPGWMAVALRPQQIELAHVLPASAGGMPRLALLDSLERERGTDADALARLRRSFGLQRYRFSTRKWDTLKAGGDYFPPRYLAALGTDSGGRSR